MPTVTCKECGQPFEVIQSREATAKYCSRACMYAARSGPRPELRNRVELDCGVCGESFRVIPSREETARYCSRECKDAAPRPHQRTGEWLTCPTCGERFYVVASRLDSAKYCSMDCRWSNLSDRGGHVPEWLRERADDFTELRELPQKRPKQRMVAPHSW